MSHAESTQRIIDALGLTEAPIAVYYSDEPLPKSYMWNGQKGHFCTISRMSLVRQGTPLVVDGQNPGCPGGAFFLGFSPDVRPGFECFLSHAPDGTGERYKKTPELAKAYITNRKFVPASARYCIFQRLSDLPDEITPEVVTFFAPPDELSGLFWMANYGSVEQNAVISPFSAGCGSIVSEARAQASSENPKGVLGMFDPSARQHMEKHLLTITVPFSLYTEMVENITGSFLEIAPWTRLRGR